MRSQFPDLLGIAKILGILAHLVNGAARLKDWAHAGFIFTFLGALRSHLASGQQKEAVMPIVVLIVLVVFYLLRPPGRRLIEPPAHNP